jgi:hypothetical protein
MTASFTWPTVRPLFHPGAMLIASVLALAAAGCGGNKPVARGFDSQEIYPVRDPSLVFDGIGNANTLLYSTGGSVTGQGASYWSLDLATGMTQAQSDPSSTPPSSTGSGPYTCVFTFASTANGTGKVVITEVATGASTEIDNVVSYGLCPGSDGMLSLFQLDADTGNLTLSSGPFTQLQVIPLTVEPQAVEWWYAQTDGQLAGAVVEANLPGQSGSLGLYTVAVPSGTVSSDVPPTPMSTAWATGATPSGTMQSSGLMLTSDGIWPYGSYFFYPRAMADGSTTMFAGPFASGPASELALFPLPPGSTSLQPYRALPDTTTARSANFPQLVSWQLGGPASSLMVWDDGNHQVTACPSEPQAYLGGLISPDYMHALFVTPQGCCAYQGNGPLSLLTLGGAGGSDSCTSLVSDGVVTAGFAPDSSAIFWLTQLPTGDDQLWIAAGDGSGAQMVGSGGIDDIHFIPGTERLELILAGDAVWLDVHDNPMNLHYIAEQVFGIQADVVGSWVVTGYDFNTQDETGTLGVVNRDDGTKRVISPAVAQYLVLQQSTGSDGGALLSNPASTGDPNAVLEVIYQVRGRNPSPQDGIWLATVRAADLQ